MEQTELWPQRKREAEPLPTGRHSVVLADPPWRYYNVATPCRAIENHYPTMTNDQICDLPIADLLADEAVLFLWGTSPNLPVALRVMDAWGFRYVTCAVWVKDRIGMGYHFRQRHELLLLGKRGDMPSAVERPDSVILAPREGHSRKPDCIHAMIDSMYPVGRRVELFARRQMRGWDVWGNDVDGMAS